MTPAACAVIFRTGPLAWDGAVSFWLSIGAFGLNVAVMFVVLRSAINRQASDEAPEDELPQDTGVTCSSDITPPSTSRPLLPSKTPLLGAAAGRQFSRPGYASPEGRSGATREKSESAHRDRGR
jgi:hypothetical protein